MPRIGVEVIAHSPAIGYVDGGETVNTQWEALDYARRLGFPVNPDVLRSQDFEEVLAFIHAWMERMTQCHLSRLDQYERLGVLWPNNGNNGIGSGGLGFTHELPQCSQRGSAI